MDQLNIPIVFTENTLFDSQKSYESYGLDKIEQFIGSDLSKMESNIAHMENEVQFMMRDKKTKVEFESTMLMLFSMLRGEISSIRRKKIVLNSVATTTHTITTI